MDSSNRFDSSLDTPTTAGVAVTGWSDRADSILGGDLVAVLGIVTPASGVLLHPVAPVGLRDRHAGTVSFTSSLGYWKKLQRIEQSPRVGLLYSDRSHGHAIDTLTVLAQGDAEIESEPDEAFLAELFDQRMPRFFGPTLSGPGWDRLTRDYYRIRVRVTVSLRRLRAWQPGSGDIVEAAGELWPSIEPAEQLPTGGGTGPRVSVAKAARRAAQLRTTCLGYLGGDGYPVLVPVTVRETSEKGLGLASVHPLPAGGRRAGLFSQSYGPGLKGASIQHHSGWLHVSKNGPVFSPHTYRGFTAPFGKRTATLGGSLQAKAGIREARRRGLVVGDRWTGSLSIAESTEVSVEEKKQP